MEILRAKTKELFKTPLNPAQEANSALNLKELESCATKLQSRPRRVILEMTSACNIKCIFCGRDEAEFNQTYLSPSVLDKLAPVLQVCEEVTLFGWGEPTINPRFSEFLARLHKTPVRKYFVTNGMRLNKFIDDIFKYRVDIIAVSLDGATSRVNDKIRAGSSFEKITANIRAIMERKNALGADFPYMNFVFVAMESNIRELPKMIPLAKNLQMQEVKVVFLSAFSPEMLPESLFNKQDLVAQIFSESAKIAQDLGIKLKLPYLQGCDIAGAKYHKDCFVGWRDFFLGSDDSIRPCQSTSLKLGKFSDFSDFESAWNSKAFQNFRASVNANNCDKNLAQELGIARDLGDFGDSNLNQDSSDSSISKDSSANLDSRDYKDSSANSRANLNSNNSRKAQDSCVCPPPNRQNRNALAMQTLLPKFSCQLEQTAKLYPSRADFCPRMGEKSLKSLKLPQKHFSNHTKRFTPLFHTSQLHLTLKAS